MKKNKAKKIVLILILIIMFCMFFMIQTSFADEYDDIVTRMNGINNPSGVNSTKVSSVMQIIINLIRIAGAGIAIIMVTITGIKYIYSSPDDKAEYKKKLIPMLIGAVLLVSATEIIAIIGDIAIEL